MPKWVSASQLNQWAYCSRQFYLAQVVGLTPDRGAQRRFRKGLRRHQRHGRLATGARRLGRVALWLLVLAGLGVAVVLLSAAAPLAPLSESLPELVPDGYAERLRAARAWAGAADTRLLIPLAGLAATGAAALMLRLFARRLHTQTGLPEHAEIVASDTGQNRVALLRHWRHGLVGKPDYVLRRRTLFGSRLFAVELKPSRRSRRLQAGDELQALAYILLLRGEHGRRAARYAYVVYAEHSFRVELTRASRRKLLRAARDIRRARRARDVPRSHDEPLRCVRCAFRTQCAEALA